MKLSHYVSVPTLRRARPRALRCFALAVMALAGGGCTAAAYQPPGAAAAQPAAPVSPVAALNNTAGAVRPPPDTSTARSAVPAPPPGVRLDTVAAAVGAAAAQTAPGNDYKLGPEDLLQITLYNVAANEQGVMPRTVDVRVSHQGRITMPLLGDVAVVEHTPSWLEQQLKAKYRTYFVDPQISVFVREYRSQRVSVLGAVQHPGVFELTGPKTIVDLLALAGGVTDQASRQVQLVRAGPQGRESYVVDLQDLTGDPAVPANLTVTGGDVLSVPRAGSFFVDGAVSKPGAYRLDRPYTLTQALATAGGCDRDVAQASATQIFRRRNGTTPETLTVDINKIPRGEAEDPLIYADDVIVVPISTPRYVVKRFLGAIGMGIGVPIR